MNNCLLFYCTPGFKHFTDYRCFHFAHRDFTERGVTKSVGMLECKPDACSPIWGDTQLRAGVLALNVYVYLHDVSFITSLCCLLLYPSRRYCASHEGPTAVT